MQNQHSERRQQPSKGVGKAAEEGLNHQLVELASRVGEVLLEADFGDAERLGRIILEAKARREQRLIPSGHTLAASRLKGNTTAKLSSK